ncbi:hypothetical protein BGZ51_003521 [Haplosporangium sp. Z 767]|nr:hypothetical protein BGZ51_003521 [Haplosporangium sp. Z 767]KAF9191367.1 hypothetical protein BGZ50_009422 [Haplosporangium sp. Z 11]
MKPDPRSTRGKRSLPSEIGPPESRRIALVKRQATSNQDGGASRTVKPRAKPQSRTVSGTKATATAPRSRAPSARKRTISATVSKNKTNNDKDEDADETKTQGDDDLASNENDDEAGTAPSTIRNKKLQQPKPGSKNVASKKPRKASTRSAAPETAPTTSTTRKRAADTPVSSKAKRSRSATPATTRAVTSQGTGTRTVRALSISARAAPLPTISEPAEDTEVADTRDDGDGSASSASNATETIEQEELSEMDTTAVDNQYDNESDVGTETDPDVAERVSRCRRASGRNRDSEYPEYSPREVAASQALFSLQQQTSQVHYYKPKYGNQNYYYHQDPHRHQHGNRCQDQEYNYRHSVQSCSPQPVPFQYQQLYSESSRRYVHDHPHVHRHRHRHLHRHRHHHPPSEHRSFSSSTVAYPPDQRHAHSQIQYLASYAARNQSSDFHRAEQSPRQSIHCTEAMHQSIYDWGFRDGMMAVGIDPDDHSTHQQQNQNHESDQNQEQPQQGQHDEMQIVEVGRDGQSTDRPQPEQQDQEKVQQEQQMQKAQKEEQEEQDRSCTPMQSEFESDAGQPNFCLPILPLIVPKLTVPLGEASPVTQADIPESQSPSWTILAPIDPEPRDRTQMLPGPADIEAALASHIPLPRSPSPSPSPSCRPSSSTKDQ